MSVKKQDSITIKNEVWTEERIRNLLKRNNIAVLKGLERIYSFQTVEEKYDKSSKTNNKKGFNKCHVKIMSDYYVFYKSNGYLTKKQMETARNIMLHYTGQLFRYMKGTI